MYTVDLLASLDDESAVKPLIKALKGKDVEERMYMSEALKDLTGADVTWDYSAWMSWYKKNK